jgi:transcriptional regulator
MYIPAHFKEDRVPVLHDAIRPIGFASLVTSGEGGLEASHLPMLVSPEPAPFGTLHGHVARGNPQWKSVEPRSQALVIFLGPSAYITPSWYATKQQTGKVAPTWDYLAIHAYGEISFFEDRAQLRDHVGELTEAHESARSSPWAVTDAPTDYMDKMLGAIVGFKIAITRLEGKWKMSQNRSPQDIAGVQIGLASEDGAPQKAVADIMAKLVRP